MNYNGKEIGIIILSGIILRGIIMGLKGIIIGGLLKGIIIRGRNYNVS